MNSFSFVCCLMAVCLYSGAPIVPIQLDRVALALRWPVVSGYTIEITTRSSCRLMRAGLTVLGCTHHVRTHPAQATQRAR